MSIASNLTKIKQCLPTNVVLVAVSKTKSVSEILEAYHAGQQAFGENKIQEMVEKYSKLPKDIEWHMIGHLQTNKIKYMAHFVSLIHGVDSFKKLKEINKQAIKHNRTINCLLQIKIAEEETKFGISIDEATEIISSEAFKSLTNIKVVGLMGMASFTSNEKQIHTEYHNLKTGFDKIAKMHPECTVLSMGMSGDYTIAIEEGSTMVRIGSSIFGNRNYN